MWFTDFSCKYTQIASNYQTFYLFFISPSMFRCRWQLVYCHQLLAGNSEMSFHCSSCFIILLLNIVKLGFKCGKCDSIHILGINYVQNYTFSALEPNNPPFFFLILVCLFCCLAFIWRTNRVLTHVVNRVSLYIFWLSLKQIRMWTCIDQQQCQFLIILFPYPRFFIFTRLLSKRWDV